jgi:cytochrome P450
MFHFQDLHSQMGDLRSHAEKLTTSLFGPMLNPDAEKGQSIPSDRDLTAEAMLMVGAGTDTTANALCVGAWMLLNDPGALENLNHELRTVMPDKDSPIDLTTLEGLPFLVS